MNRPHEPFPSQDEEQKKKKTNKSKFTSFCMNTVICMLICSVAFVFLIFKTNSVIDVDEVSTTPISLQREITVSQTISSGSPDVSPFTPGVFPETGEWYSDFPQNMRTKGSIVEEIPVTYGSAVPLYNNIPWDYEEGCYIYNINTACNDFVAFLDANADQPTNLNLTSYWARESPTPGYYIPNYTTCVTLEGIESLVVAFPPCAITKEYNDGYKDDPGLWYKTSEVWMAVDGFKYNQSNPIRFCIIVKDKDTGSQYFIPACLGDMKGHTWPGGVTQTEARLHSGESPSGPFVIDIGDNDPAARHAYAANVEYTVREMANNLDTIEPETNSHAKWREYIKCCIEICLAPEVDLNKFTRFDIVAIMAWPQKG